MVLPLSKILVHCKFHHYKCTWVCVEVAPEMLLTDLNKK